MANFKCRRPRTAPGSRYSGTGWRSRNNMKPIKIPEFDFKGKSYTNTRYTLEYLRFLEWKHRTLWPDSKPSPMGSWPRWHDVMHHTRPRRRRDRATASAVFHGKIDPENATWELSKKPHIFYW